MSLHHLGKREARKLSFRRQWQSGIRGDQPHGGIEMKFCMVGDLQEIVLRFEFYRNRSSGFGAVGAKFALSR